MNSIHTNHWWVGIIQLLLNPLHLLWLAGNLTGWLIFRSEINLYLYVVYLLFYLVLRRSHQMSVVYSMLGVVLIMIFLL